MLERLRRRRPSRPGDAPRRDRGRADPVAAAATVPRWWSSQRSRPPSDVVSSLTPAAAPTPPAPRLDPHNRTCRRHRAVTRTAGRLVLVAMVLAGSALATRWAARRGPDPGGEEDLDEEQAGAGRGGSAGGRYRRRRPRACTATQTREQQCWQRTRRWPVSCPAACRFGAAEQPAGPTPPPSCSTVRSRPGWWTAAARGPTVPRGPVQRAPDGRGRPRAPSTAWLGSAASTGGPPWLTRAWPRRAAREKQDEGRAPRPGYPVASAPRWSSCWSPSARSRWPPGWWRCPLLAVVAATVALLRVPAAPPPRPPRPAGPPVENAPFRSYRQVSEALSWASGRRGTRPGHPAGARPAVVFAAGRPPPGRPGRRPRGRPGAGRRRPLALARPRPRGGPAGVSRRASTSRP